MHYRAVIIILVFLSVGTETAAQSLTVNGYVKELPIVQYSDVTDELFFDNILHQRLNVRWDLTENLYLKGGQRTRYFYGNFPQNPLFKDFLERDFGTVNLSHIVFDHNKHMLHTVTDRLFVNWKSRKWRIRAGRQRVNWGINTVTNPNDLFNNYSFFDFDYEERPGTDALRVTYFSGALSRWELAASPGRKPRESVYAGLYRTNFKGYDIQGVAGYFHHRAAVGGGWAGHLKKIGFKGEFTYFHDIEKQPGLQRGNLVAAVSLDYMFNNGLFWTAEFIYNQQRREIQQGNFVLLEPLRADNITFSDLAAFTQLQYSFKVIHTFGLGGFYFPNEQAFFAAPNYSLSVGQNLDLTLMSQLFITSSNSVFSGTPYNLITMLKWSF